MNCGNCCMTMVTRKASNLRLGGRFLHIYRSKLTRHDPAAKLGEGQGDLASGTGGSNLMKEALFVEFSIQKKALKVCSALIAIVLFAAAFSVLAVAQDQDDQNDPPGRVARLGYI